MATTNVLNQPASSSMSQPPPTYMAPGPQPQPVMVASPPPQVSSTTTIVTSGGGVGVIGDPMMVNNFNVGICDCFSDLNVCLLSCFCPCVVYGQVERLLQTNGADPSTDFGQCCCCYCGSLVGNAVLAFIGLPGIVHAFFICGQRSRFRKRANIIGSDCEDAAWSCCCPHCALGQVLMEETRFKVLSRNPLGLAPQPQMMIAGPPPGPQVTVVTTGNGQPQPIYAQPQYMPVYASGQPAYAPAPGQPVYAMPPQPQYGQPMYAQPPPGAYYAPAQGAAPQYVQATPQ